ncbi:MAG TPA: YjhG/YagF family D-xylonate dehydratase [Verrucomicrobiales bacterium]|nr:YjhG/YagF family D-xylonate dehydratase [Verrucomicrobiales bacterium]
MSNVASHDIFSIQTKTSGPAGKLPLSAEEMRSKPSGDIFGMTQSAGMGWKASELGRDHYLVLSTQGGLRAPDGQPIALGFHTGHWEIALQAQTASERLRELGGVPFAAYCSDPCDGRTQGTVGMFDSLPYRNDAAQVFRRLARSLPTRKGILGVATCDKGLPAMMMALAGLGDLPSVIVPGGVSLPPEQGEDAGAVQTIGARFSHGMLSLDEATELGCKACASPGGGCQFLGTAATSQVVAEAMGMAVPHSALAPSGQPVWLDIATRSADAVVAMKQNGTALRDILTPAALKNAMALHAAFGGSTNLLLHIPAIAYCAGIDRPTVDEWSAINKAVPRIVDVLPNGPTYHPTVRVFLAGGVPEVMLHLHELNLIDASQRSVTGRTIDEELNDWEQSERRQRFREILKEQDGVDPNDVILSPERARDRGLTSTVMFPSGNLAPEGAVIKSTAIDPSLVDENGVYAHEGPAKVFTSEHDAIAAIKQNEIEAGDVLVVTGCGPIGTGMEETYQLTSALKFLPFGKHVALVTDARFSGVSTGACIGHVGPEGLAGGPIGKLKSGDVISIQLNRNSLEGFVNLVGEGDDRFDAEEGAKRLAKRETRDDIAPHSALPDDTRLWAALQGVGGGTWGGCVFDVDQIVARLQSS